MLHVLLDPGLSHDDVLSLVSSQTCPAGFSGRRNAFGGSKASTLGFTQRMTNI